MTYRKSFPKKYQGTPWLFRVISRLWYIDKVHRDNCACEGCWAPQRNLF